MEPGALDVAEFARAVLDSEAPARMQSDEIATLRKKVEEERARADHWYGVAAEQDRKLNGSPAAPEAGVVAPDLTPAKALPGEVHPDPRGCYGDVDLVSFDLGKRGDCKLPATDSNAGNPFCAAHAQMERDADAADEMLQHLPHCKAGEADYCGLTADPPEKCSCSDSLAPRQQEAADGQPADAAGAHPAVLRVPALADAAGVGEQAVPRPGARDGEGGQRAGERHDDLWPPSAAQPGADGGAAQAAGGEGRGGEGRAGEVEVSAEIPPAEWSVLRYFVLRGGAFDGDSLAFEGTSETAAKRAADWLVANKLSGARAEEVSRAGAAAADAAKEAREVPEDAPELAPASNYTQEETAMTPGEGKPPHLSSPRWGNAPSSRPAWAVFHLWREGFSVSQCKAENSNEIQWREVPPPDASQVCLDCIVLPEGTGWRKTLACRIPGCGELGTDAGRFCPDHTERLPLAERESIVARAERMEQEERERRQFKEEPAPGEAPLREDKKKPCAKCTMPTARRLPSSLESHLPARDALLPYAGSHLCVRCQSEIASASKPRAPTCAGMNKAAGVACAAEGKVERGGKWWCGKHDPEKGKRSATPELPLAEVAGG
jgi:hypothetical protein